MHFMFPLRSTEIFLEEPVKVKNMLVTGLVHSCEISTPGYAYSPAGIPTLGEYHTRVK